MAGGGQQAENTLHENTIGWAILCAVLAVVAYVFWYFQATEVRNIIRWIRFGEIWLVSWVIEALNYTGIFGEEGYQVNFLNTKISFSYGLNGDSQPTKQGYKGVAGLDKNELNLYYLTLINALAMQPLRPVFSAICVIFGIWCIFRGPRTFYRSKLDLQGLIHRQSTNFPIIAPFRDFNPSTQPPRPPGSPVPAELPQFAEALGPEEWIAYNNIAIPDGEIDRESAAKHFKKQLLGRWKGAMALEPHRQILLACFCLKAARKRDESDIMLGRLANCWSFKEGLNLNRDKKLLKEAQRILKNKDLAGDTLAKANQHAYVTTALLRALQFAREEGGVLAPASFVWLRGYDRTLWYPLNNMGRQSFHPEALGAMAHFTAEKRTQRPIPMPKVEFAVDTIRDYMKSMRARPIPQLDYSNSKKRGVKKAV